MFQKKGLLIIMSDTTAIVVDVLMVVAAIASLVGFIKFRQRPLGVFSWIVLCTINISGLIQHHDSWWLIIPVTAGCALWPATVAWGVWRRRRTLR